jgi:hypothetical protein
MKINWYAEIGDIWGKPIPIPREMINGEATPNLTLRHAIVEALGMSGSYPGEESMTGDERVRRMALAFKIRDALPGQDIQLKAEDIAAIKSVCLKRWPQAFIIAQIYQAIDPGEAPPVAKREKEATK